jgi:hypothetical protein
MTRVKLLTAFILIVMLPLQSFAAGYQLKCVNAPVVAPSLKSSDACHNPSMHAASDSQTDARIAANHKNKSQCLSSCAQINMVAVISTVGFQISSIVFNDCSPLLFNYASITLPNFQRPPINLC